jgi:thymidylate synthase
MTEEHLLNVPPFETQYKKALQTIMGTGIRVENRTGIDTIKINHQYFYLKDIAKNFPAIKAKKQYPKMGLKEIVWFMSGITDVEWLENQGVKYWSKDGWLDENRTVGKTYGYQFRKMSHSGMDNFGQFLDHMVEYPESRRHILNIWGHEDIAEMKLPPCLYDYHISITKIYEGKYRVDLNTTQRSADMFLGVPYNFIYSAWFLLIITSYLNANAKNGALYEAKDVHFTTHDTHIYDNQIIHGRNSFRMSDIHKAKIYLNVITHRLIYNPHKIHDYSEEIIKNIFMKRGFNEEIQNEMWVEFCKLKLTKRGRFKHESSFFILYKFLPNVILSK